jgi:deoxycytidylate deaminase
MYTSPKAQPYLPDGRNVQYVPEDNSFMARARELCSGNQFFCKQPTAAVIVKGKKIVAEGVNGDEPRLAFCPRQVLDCKTGQGYEFCPGCQPRNHGEGTAIRKSDDQGLASADLYLYGHWWCCKQCWDEMIAAGIKNVYLVERATELFETVTAAPAAYERKNLSAYVAPGPQDGTNSKLHQAVRLAGLRLAQQPSEATVVIAHFDDEEQFDQPTIRYAVGATRPGTRTRNGDPMLWAKDEPELLLLLAEKLVEVLPQEEPVTA